LIHLSPINLFRRINCNISMQYYLFVAKSRGCQCNIQGNIFNRSVFWRVTWEAKWKMMVNEQLNLNSHFQKKKKKINRREKKRIKINARMWFKAAWKNISGFWCAEHKTLVTASHLQVVFQQELLFWTFHPYSMSIIFNPKVPAILYWIPWKC
jgi:hypothetical protein